MTSNGSGKSKDFQKRLAQLKERSFEVKFDIDGSDYTAVENIGIGAYGVVCSAVHNKTGDRVAIKKIHKAFEFEKIATRTYREIKILKHFKHDNIISIRDILKPKGSVKEFTDIYIVLDLMESDLHRIIYSKQELTEEHVRYFLYQLLRGLKYIHSGKVIHRDLKPSNLLVNEDCQLRIGDFGMARGLSSNPEEPNHFMTQYVATRWYRAPEIMLSMVEYSSAVDMWSVGCIFAEMLGRKHLFPGKDYIQQIKYIIGVLGSPSQAVMDLCNSDIIKSFVNQLGKRAGISWNTLFPKASRKAINLLSRMLVLHPGERITVEDALKHHYLSKYHDPDDEPVCVPTFNFDFENQQLNVDQIREMIYKEVMEYHKVKPKSFDAFLRPAPKEPLVAKNSSEEQIVPDIQKDTDKVKVDVGKLVPSSSTDIEMLSAKVEDSIQKEATKITETEKPKETTKSDPKGQETTTVSSNTKELIKAALLNSNLRKQRQEQANEENNKNKPVTAAQRQREREEKRKKKKEKSLEKLKKKGKKGSEKTGSLLTNEDKVMLERWAKMQKNIQQIAPKPDPNQVPTTKEQTITIINIQQQVITIPSQPETSKQEQPKADVKSLGQKSFSQQNVFGIHGLSNQRGSLPLQSDLSKTQKIHLPPERRESDSCVYQMQRQENIQNLLADIQTPNQTCTVSDTVRKNENVPGFSTINMQDLKSLGISNVPFTETSSDADSLIDKLQNSSSNETLDNPSQNFTNRRSPFSQGSPLKDYSNNGSPESFTSQGSPENFLNTSDSSDHSQSNVQTVGSGESTNVHPKTNIPSVHPVSNIQNVHPSSNMTNVHQSSNIQNVGQSSNLPNVPKNYNINQGNVPLQSNFNSNIYSENVMQGATNEGTSMLFNFSNPHGEQRQTQHISQNFSSQPTTEEQIQKSNQTFVNPTSQPFNSNFPLNSSVEQPSFFSSSYDESFLSGQNFTGNFQPYDTQHDLQSKFSRRTSCNQEFNNFSTCEYNNDIFSNYDQDLNIGMAQNFQGYNASRDLGTFPSVGMTNTNYGNQQQAYHQNFGLSSTNIPQQNQQGNVPFQSYASSQLSSVSQPVATDSSQQARPTKQPDLQINTNTPPDLITVLSKQFSRSQVEDLCPPALALTPRGTGAGYGVGMDLDSLIMDSQDNELGRAEPSPLSSSLLTDWMEVTGDLNIDMDALEQELSLQSPMALSYSDLSMYPS